MEAGNNNLSTAAESSPALLKKPRKTRFKKLTEAELTGLPGAIPMVVKAPEPKTTYFVCFSVPVTGPLGTVAEATAVHDFAYHLGMRGVSDGVGSVAEVSFADGSAEIVLKLNDVSGQVSRAAPIADTFTKLGDFLGTSQILRENHSGKRATWKAKINGTTIAEGRY